MKKLRIFLAMTAVLAGAALVASCSSDDGDPEPPATITLRVSPTTLTQFSAYDATNQNLTVNTNSEKWDYEVSDPSWIKVTVDSNNANRLIVTAEDNTTGEVRNGTITFTAQGYTGDAIVVAVSQADKGSSQDELEVSASSLAFDREGDAKTTNVITVTSNVDYEVTKGEDDNWFTFTENKTAKTITVNVEANTTNEARSGLITVSYGSLVKNITITQDRNPFVGAIELDKFTAGTVAEREDSYMFKIQFQSDAYDYVLGIQFQGYASKSPAWTEDWLIPAGTYTVGNSTSPLTIVPGSVPQNIYGTLGFDTNGETITVAYLATSGTAIVSYSGDEATIDFKISGTKLNLTTNASETFTDMEYQYKGTYKGAFYEFLPWGGIEFGDYKDATTYNATGTPGYTETPGPGSWSGIMWGQEDAEYGDYYGVQDFGGNTGNATIWFDYIPDSKGLELSSGGAQHAQGTMVALWGYLNTSTSKYDLYRGSYYPAVSGNGSTLTVNCTSMSEYNTPIMVGCAVISGTSIVAYLSDMYENLVIVKQPGSRSGATMSGNPVKVLKDQNGNWEINGYPVNFNYTGKVETNKMITR